MHIRSIEKKDLEEVKKLIKAHAQFEKACAFNANNLDYLGNYIFNSSTVTCLVVELQNELVGYATFMKQFSTWDAHHYLYLDCLYLDEKTRGKGIGTQMMDSIKTHAKSLNCTIIQWQTPSFNKTAIRFYDNLGAQSKTKKRYSWKPLSNKQEHLLIPQDFQVKIDCNFATLVIH